MACLILIISCEKEKLASTTAVRDMVDTSAVKKASGNFINGPYGSVMGNAAIYKTYSNTYQVQLDSFVSSNGPDLHVYLSKQIMPVDFIDLGKLKSTNGTQVYEVPTGSLTDFSTYKYVCIHCKAYNHLFGSAQVQ